MTLTCTLFFAIRRNDYVHLFVVVWVALEATLAPLMTILYRGLLQAGDGELTFFHRFLPVATKNVYRETQESKERYKQAEQYDDDQEVSMPLVIFLDLLVFN